MKTKAEMFEGKDELGNTALYYAVSGGHVETVRLLINAGVNVNNK